MERNYRKTKIGMVVSNKMDKTIVVAIADNVKHPFTARLLKELISLKLMMKIILAELVTE